MLSLLATCGVCGEGGGELFLVLKATTPTAGLLSDNGEPSSVIGVRVLADTDTVCDVAYTAAAGFISFASVYVTNLLIPSSKPGPLPGLVVVSSPSVLLPL